MKEVLVSWWTGGRLALIACLVTVAAIFATGTIAQAAPQYALDCTSCHKMAPLDSADGKKNPMTGAVPGNHQTHAPATGAVAADCVVCHTSGVTSYGNSHRNKTIELEAGLSYTREGWPNQVASPPNPLGTCSNVNCHSDGKGNYRVTPAWGSTAAPDCTTCHDLARTTGSHVKHATYYGNDSADDCVKCHLDRTGNFQHAMGGQAAGITLNATLETAFDTGTSECSNLYCHSNGQSTTYTNPTWGGAATTCTSCHGDAASDTLSGKHPAHVNNAGVLGTSYGCQDCHAATVSDSTTISNLAKHVDGVKDFSACTVCHQDGKGAVKTVTWDQVGSLDCKGCHGSDAAPAFTSVAGEPNYSNGGADNALANSHKKHVSAATDCVRCHNGTTTDGVSIVGNHTNGTINVAAGGGKSFDFTEAGETLTCSNISCHSGGGIVADVQPAKWGATLDCKGCHGDSSTLATGAHAAHVSTGYACETCHNATVTGSTTISNTANHANSAINVAGARITTFTDGANTCATSCHNSLIPAVTPDWNNPASGACGTCHAATEGTLVSGSHNTHINALVVNGPHIGCATCHDTASAQHVDLGVDMLAGMNEIGTCGTCHTVSATWGTASTVDCQSCHTGTGSTISVAAPLKDNAATAGHGKTGIAKACTDCHDSASAHISGALGDSDRLLVALGTGDAACTYCHNDDTEVPNAAMRNMTTHVTSTCADCHDPHGTSNASMVNAALASFDGTNFVNAAGTGICQSCHTTTQYFTAGVEDTTHADAGTNCLQCHAHQAGFVPNGNCDGCHGYPPAPQYVLGNVEYLAGSDYGVVDKWLSAKLEDYTGGGGAHLVGGHLPANITPDMGWAPCLPCHFDGDTAHNRKLPLANNVANVTVKVDTQYKFSADYPITYAQVGTGNAIDRGVETGSCSNVSCHFQPSPKWSIEQ